MELETLLVQGRELIEQTSRAHSERWGLGAARQWVLDQNDGRITWSFEDHVASAPAQILGSWNSKVGSFVWSWDNETIKAPLCTTAEEVRAFGLENDVVALCSSPLRIDESQVRDLVALAFRLGGCTGLYHPFDGRLASYIAFGDVTIEEAGRTSVFEVSAR
jgi:uncharacterized protein DUF6882